MPPEHIPDDARRFRNALGAFATGVTIVTSRDATGRDVGLTATWRQQWALDVRYYGSDISRANCYGTNWCEPALVAKVTYSFAVL